MRAITYLASIAALTLTLSLAAVAEDSSSGKFDLTQSARIGSTVLPPGHYKAEWSGSNSSLIVTIVSHGKTVATTHGHLKELPSRSPYDAVESHPGRNHTQVVDEIDFNNRSEALRLAGV